MHQRLDEFARWGYDTRGWSSQTRGQYTRRVAAFTRHLAARGVRPERATPELLLGWLSTLPPTAASRNQARKALAGYYAHLQATGARADDPAAGLPALRPRPGVPKALDPQAAAAVWAAARAAGPRDAALIAVMLYAGLRATEARTLTADDVDEGWLRFRGKGGVQRMVPLHPEARAALRAWRQSSPTWCVFPSPAWPDAPTSYEQVRRVVARLGRDAGLDHLTPHVLRHTFATAAMESGADLPVVQHLLGHRSPATTGVYLRVRPARLAEAVARLDYTRSSP